MRVEEFSLYDEERRLRSLNEWLNTEKPLILLFFPGAFTSVCTKEMCTFRDYLNNFSDFRANLVGISVDSPFVLKEFKERYRLSFTLLSDYSREVIRKLGIYHEDFAGLRGYTVAKRAVFILDNEGNLVYQWIADNPSDEPPYDVIREKLKEVSN